MVDTIEQPPAPASEVAGDGALVERLRMAGVNHRSAPLELREKLALVKGAAVDTVERLRREVDAAELVAVSTCNRTEFYWAGRDGAEIDPIALFRALPGVDGAVGGQIDGAAYAHSGREAVRHLYRVVCGLDSLVLGETQILHQVKRAYERSAQLRATGPVLNGLFQRAFAVAKEVHTRTRLAADRASIPTVALDVAQAIFEDLSEAFVLVLGTGEIAEVTLEALRKRGAKRIAFVSRTAERAMTWTGSAGAEIGTLDDLPRLLGKADIVVSCTAVEKPVITAAGVQRAMSGAERRGRPLLVLDLGVPRNVEPAVGEIEQVYLRNVDDLEEVVAANRSRQEGSVSAASEIVSSAIEEYCRESRAATAASTIREFRSAAERVAAEELSRTLGRLSLAVSPKDREEVSRLTERLVGKILHPPTEALREASRNGRALEAVEWARRFFGLKI